MDCGVFGEEPDLVTFELCQEAGRMVDPRYY